MVHHRPENEDNTHKGVQVKRTKFQQAFDVFCKTIENDKSLYNTYQSTIAISFIDEFHSRGYRVPEIHNIANKAAINFLNMMIEKAKP